MIFFCIVSFQKGGGRGLLDVVGCFWRVKKIVNSACSKAPGFYRSEPVQ